MLMVSCCHRGGDTKGRQGRAVFIFNLLSLPNTLCQQEKNPPSSRGSEDEERKVRNGPLDHVLPHNPFKSSLGPPPPERLVPRDRGGAGRGAQGGAEAPLPLPPHLQ